MTKIIKTLFIAFAIISSAYATTPLSQKEISEIQNLELFQKAQVTVKKRDMMQEVYIY